MSEVTWRDGDYRFVRKSEGKGGMHEINHYQGAYTDWELKKTMYKGTWITYLVDMTLYMGPDDLEGVIEQFKDVGNLYVSDFSNRLGALERQKDRLGSVSKYIVEWIWEGDHHWGKLMTKDISDEMFVAGYLFRLLNGLSKYDNLPDAQRWIHTTADSLTAGDVIKLYKGTRMKDGTLLDEYISRNGFTRKPIDEADGLDYMKDNAQERVYDYLESMVDNYQVYSHWEKLIRAINHIGKSVVFGDYEKGTSLDKADCLADATIKVVGGELATLVSNYMDEDVEKR